MFKKPLLAFAVFGMIAAAGGCVQTAGDAATDQAKLQSDALIWFEHYAKADADGLANLYAEDALLMPPGAPAVTGRPGIKTFLGEDAAKSKAAGISLKNGSVTGTGVSGDSGSYLSIHRRTTGAWLYIRDIWNSDRPPAPPAPIASGKK